MKLIIVRHGETVWNAEDKAQGFQHNSPFTEKGLRQIRSVSRKIKKIRHIDTVYTACLSRCIEAVEEALAGKGDVPIVLSQQLQQRNWGTLGGMTRAQIGARYPESGYNSKGETIDEDKKFIFRPPQGETWGEVQARVKQFLDTIIATHTGNQTVVIVTHLGISRTILSLLSGVSMWQIEKVMSYSSANIFTIVPGDAPDIFRVYNPSIMLRFKHRFYNDYRLTNP